MSQAFCTMSRFVAAAVFCLCLVTSDAFAASKDSVEAFLKTTGFDVAIDSIALSAENAPAMLGFEEGEFSAEWKRIADRVFAEDLMRARAVGILQETLDDDMLAHAAGFYATDLGMRLVEAENLSHFADDAVKQNEGHLLLEALEKDNSERIEAFRRMSHAIDPNDIGPRAIQEIQIRFLLAAAYAGIIHLRVDEDGLRAAMAEDYEAMKGALEESALIANVWTYRDFSDEEVLAYADALEEPDMATVYELMNAVHFEVMMNRFEALALEMGQAGPAEEL